MPCPDFDVSIVQRSENMSAVNSSAYLSASKLFCEYDQEHKDYRYKQNELFHEEVMLPVNAPPEYADRQKLWNSVEAVETQWNSQLARKMRFALSREVPREQWGEMVRKYCQEQFVNRGMCVDFAIHDPHPQGHNPHVHLLLTMRSLDEEGRWMPKAKKEYVLDEDGNRIRDASGRDCPTVDGASKIERKVVSYTKAAPNSTLPDVADGKVSLEEFVASLDLETLLRIVTGVACETKHPVPARLPKGKMKPRSTSRALKSA